MLAPLNDKLAVITIVAVLSATSSAGLAQTTPPPAGLDCTRLALAEQAAPRVDTRAVRSGEDRVPVAVQDRGCWIDLDQVKTKGVEVATLVDVRSAADASATRIPGALQIPLSEIRTKDFLKAASLILIGSGKDDADLGRACGELREQGFKTVKLLRGGIRSWYEGGRPLQVNAAYVDTLDLISPAEFQRQAGTARWVIVAVDIREPSELLGGASGLRRISAGDNVTSAIASISRIQAELVRSPREDRPHGIVIVSRDETTAQQLRDEVSRAGLKNVLTLKGGVAGYQTFLAQQQAIAANAGKPLVRPCGSG